MKHALLGFLLVLAAGCAARTRINSEPPGARVLIERQFVGYTPIELTLGVGCGRVRLEAPGHQAVEGRLASRGDPRAWSAVLLPPLLLLPGVPRRPHEHYLVRLTPGGGVQEVAAITPSP